MSKSAFSFDHFNCSFPCIGKDFPSLIEALDNQKVEFLACGGSHTALLTKVCVSLFLPRKSLVVGEALEHLGGGT